MPHFTSVYRLIIGKMTMITLSKKKMYSNEQFKIRCNKCSFSLSAMVAMMIMFQILI